MTTHTHFVNTEPVDQKLAVAQQLRPQDMAAVARAGFRSVINNRPDNEEGPHQPASRDLQAAAAAAGLEYHYLPVPSAGHSEVDARQMARLVDSLQGPVLAFCRSGRRSAALYRLGRSLG